MLLRKGTLRLNVGSLGPCAQESQRGVQVESGSRSHTLLHTTAGEGDIRAGKKKRSREKEERKIEKKGKGEKERGRGEIIKETSDQIRSVAQPCPTLCDPMNHSTPGLPVHHQLPEFTQTHVHRVGDAIQPSHPLSSPSPPAPNPSQHQSPFQ